MSVYYHYQDLPAFKNPVVTIGSFDGVHQGHKAILKEVVHAAKAVGGESVLITFEPHPRKIIQPDIHLGLLTSLEQKIRLIKAEGIDHIVVVPFTRDFSMLSAKDYVEDFLIKNFHPKKIVIGYDHRFGHSREGDIHLLKAMISEDVTIQEISAQLIQDAAVSSTKIRNAITHGAVQNAATMLGRYYSYKATVVHGNKLGRTIGYPTANLQQDDADILLPCVGIYAVMAQYNNDCYKGMMSIGYRPTVSNDGTITCEVNILDFDKDIYGEHLNIYFIEHLRGEEKFENIEALKAQLAKDETASREVLAKAGKMNLH